MHACQDQVNINSHDSHIAPVYVFLGRVVT